VNVLEVGVLIDQDREDIRQWVAEVKTRQAAAE
jgi:hypothetical protein